MENYMLDNILTIIVVVFGFMTLVVTLSLTVKCIITVVLRMFSNVTCDHIYQKDYKTQQYVGPDKIARTRTLKIGLVCVRCGRRIPSPRK